MAETAASRGEKRILLDLALEWQAMAEQAERLQAAKQKSRDD